MYDATIAKTTASASGTKEARDARKKEHRHEHDADAKRRHERRNADLAGADQDRFLERSAEMQVAFDVLDRHDRLVDEDAHRQREAAERHQVERLAHGLEQQDRRQDRQRDRQRDDQRGSPVAEEQQHHRGRERRGDQRLADHAPDRRLDEQRLIEQRRDPDVLRQRLRDARQQRTQMGHDVEGRRTAVLQHRQQHAARTILAHDVRLRRKPVAHAGDVAHVRGCPVDGAHR
jgi:hypothetical protein